ncbi:MAG: hypothetical protein CMN29_01965 [Sandaracinus sp.]|nr:hypothetical protein [Sandaracinus sp.]
MSTMRGSRASSSPLGAGAKAPRSTPALASSRSLPPLQRSAPVSQSRSRNAPCSPTVKSPLSSALATITSCSSMRAQRSVPSPSKAKT